MPQGEILELFLSENGVNCFSSFSHYIVNFGVLRSIADITGLNLSYKSSAFEKDILKIMDMMIDDVGKRVWVWFRDFCSDCMYIIAKKYKLLDFTEYEIPNPPFLNEVKLPFFIRKPLNP